MSQQRLTAEEYENVLSFERSIHSYSGNIHNDVVRLFKKMFNWNLVVYSKWAQGDKLVTMITNGMSEDFIHGAHDRLLPGETFRIYRDHIRSNKWDGIFFSQEFDGLAKKDTELFQYLHAYNIYYFATILVGTNPNEHYLIFKTADEGPFTDHEKRILQLLQQFLSSSVNVHRDISKSRNALLVISRHLDLEGVGSVVIDDSRKALYYNESIFRMIPKDANCTKISEVADYLVTTVEDSAGSSLKKLSDKTSVAAHGYRITVEELPIVTMDNDKETFYLLSSQPEYSRDVTFDRSQSMKYNLTERETQVAELIVKGMPNKLIADNLHLSMSTVKIHNANIFRKLRVHSRLEVVEKLTKS